MQGGVLCLVCLHLMGGQLLARLWQNSCHDSPNSTSQSGFSSTGLSLEFVREPDWDVLW